jgi:hypothetical protein
VEVEALQGDLLSLDSQDKDTYHIPTSAQYEEITLLSTPSEKRGNQEINYVP